MHTDLQLSQHAEVRAQQRSVPPLILNWLFEYGATAYQPGGGAIHYFDKRAKRKLEHSCGRAIISKLKEYLDAYAVTEHDTVITLGRRYKRVTR